MYVRTFPFAPLCVCTCVCATKPRFVRSMHVQIRSHTLLSVCTHCGGDYVVCVCACVCVCVCVFCPFVLYVV